jgi:hypothetical protein
MFYVLFSIMYYQYFKSTVYLLYVLQLVTHQTPKIQHPAAAPMVALGKLHRLGGILKTSTAQHCPRLQNRCAAKTLLSNHTP